MKKAVNFKIPERIPGIFRNICDAYLRDASFLLNYIPPMNGWIMENASVDNVERDLSLDFVFISKKHNLFSDDPREVMLTFDKSGVSLIMDEETDHPTEKEWRYSEFESLEQVLQEVSDLLEQRL